MKRTQIYLLESQKEALNKLASEKNKALAEVIREAVDNYIVDNKMTMADQILEAGGLWKDREDIDSQKYVENLRQDLSDRLGDLHK